MGIRLQKRTLEILEKCLGETVSRPLLTADGINPGNGRQGSSGIGSFAFLGLLVRLAGLWTYLLVGKLTEDFQ